MTKREKTVGIITLLVVLVSFWFLVASFWFPFDALAMGASGYWIGGMIYDIAYYKGE